jgi:hypothetical protein
LIGAKRRFAHALGLELLDNALSPIRRRAVADRDVRAVVGEPQRRGGADPARSSGDECDLPIENFRHFGSFQRASVPSDTVSAKLPLGTE